MSPHERNISVKEWRPSNGHAKTGVEVLPHGFLRSVKTQDSRRSIARIEAELRKGRIVSTFANMTMLVLGPHHDSPYVRSFDEDMKHYNRHIA